MLLLAWVQALLELFAEKKTTQRQGRLRSTRTDNSNNTWIHALHELEVKLFDSP